MSRGEHHAARASRSLRASILILGLALQPAWWLLSDVVDWASIVDALSLTGWHMSSFLVLFWWSGRAVYAAEVNLFNWALLAALSAMLCVHSFLVYHVIENVLSQVGMFGLVWGPLANLAAARIGFWAYLVHRGHTRA